MRQMIATLLLAVCVSACTTTGNADRLAATTPAYVIAEIVVHDATGYREYLAAISPIVEKFGGKYLVRGGKTSPVEGEGPSGRVVVIAFPSFSAAKAFEDAPESMAAGEIRHRTSTSRIFIVEGASP
jgi:uncharacterized protein (DUF1330 family)